MAGKSSDHGEHLSSILARFRQDLRPFEDFYYDLHKHPELPRQEATTASKVAKHLRTLGFSVESGIGGHGLVGVLRNGPGKTVLVRSELDALPIEEKTGLSYASTVRMKDENGQDQPVMHACGHDMNVASLLGALATLKSAAEEWQGTVVALFQPNEEYTGGAAAMVDDNLFGRIPLPDLALAQHVVPLRAGVVATRSGVLLPSADTFKVYIFGDTGHDINPADNLNPTALVGELVSNLDRMTSADFGAKERVTIDCRAFHAGTLRGDYVTHAYLLIDVKTCNGEDRFKVLLKVRRIIEKMVRDAGIIRPPKIDTSVRAPLTDNDPGITNLVNRSFQAHFRGRTLAAELDSAVEDFSVVPRAKSIPYTYWHYGGVDPETWDEAERAGRISDTIAVNHSPYFAPMPTIALRSGADAMALAVLTFLFSDRSADPGETKLVSPL